MTDMAADIDALLEEFSFLDDWEERYRHVIALGRELPAFPAEARTEANRVSGCVSQVWLVATTTPGPPPRLTFLADSDAHIVRGLAAILLRIFSDRTPEEIHNADPEAVFRALGLDEHLSPQRANGLRAMTERIRALAKHASQA